MSSKKNKKIIQESVNDSFAEMQETPLASTFNFIPFWSYAIILLLSMMVYSNTFQHDYALDDQLAVYDNKFTNQGFDGLKSIFTKDAFVGFFGERGASLITGGRYRPLSFATFAIEWEFFGRSPHISHMVNVLLYGLLGCSIFYFFTLLFPQKKPSSWKDVLWNLPMVITLLFILHPLHTEVVANIKGRDEIMCMLFAIVTMIYSMKFLDSSDNKYLFYAGLIYFLALMSKENSITFIAVVPLMAWTLKNADVKKSILVTLPLIIGAALFLVLRAKYTISSVEAESPEILNNPWAYIGEEKSLKFATIIYSFLMYIKLMIFPNALTHDYYFNQIPYKTFKDPAVMASIALHLFLIYIGFKNVMKKNLIGFSILFYFITISIFSNIPFTVGIIMNERFVFISSLAFCILLGYRLLNEDQKWKISPIVFQSVFVVILMLYSIKTYTRNKDWYDNLSLFEADIQTSDQSAKVATALGAHYLDMSDKITDPLNKKNTILKAQQVLNHSLTIYPENSGTYLLLGNAAFKLDKNYEKSLEYFRTALHYRPGDYFDGFFNLAATFMNINKYDSSLYYAQKANAIKPEHPETIRILAFCDLVSGDIVSATKNFDQYNKLTGTVTFKTESDRMIYYADNLKEHEQYEKALNLYQSVLNSDPNNADAIHGKGLVLGKFMQKLGLALPLLEKAVSLKPENVAWKEDLAVAYGFLGKYKETIPLLEDLIKAKPTYYNGYANLAATYGLLGNKAKAEELLRQGAPYKGL